MAYKFSQKERLEIYYIELERLENMLTSQVAAEIATHKHAMKPSKTTRYKISVLRRTIASMERIVNFQADNYQNWQIARDDISRELELKMELKEELSLKIQAIESEVAMAKGMDIANVTSKAMEFTKYNQELISTKRDIEALRKELLKHLKKEPPYAATVSKEKFLAHMAANDRFAIPEGLNTIVQAAVKPREKTLGDLEYEALMRGEKLDLGLTLTTELTEEQKAEYLANSTIGVTNTIEYQPIAIADTDVSFMFAGYKSAFTEDEIKAMQQHGPITTEGDKNVNITNDEVPHQDACEDNAMESSVEDTDLHSS